MEFERPFDYVYTVKDGVISASSTTSSCDHAGAIVGFKTRRGEQVSVRIASSFISEEQAWINLKELGNHSLDEIKEKGRQRWNDVLSRIEVQDDNIDHLRTFYSCLYRSLLFPRQFFE